MNKFFADKMQKAAERQLNKECPFCGRPLIVNPPGVNDSRELFLGMYDWERENGVHYICLLKEEGKIIPPDVYL